MQDKGVQPSQELAQHGAIFFPGSEQFELTAQMLAAECLVTRVPLPPSLSGVTACTGISLREAWHGHALMGLLSPVITKTALFLLARHEADR